MKRIMEQIRKSFLQIIPRDNLHSSENISSINQNYDPSAAVGYANRWWDKRNPAYPNFSKSGMGGDCANFISQCLFAGGLAWALGPPGKYNMAQYWWCKPGATERDRDPKITFSWKVTGSFRLHWRKRVAKYTVQTPEQMLRDWNSWLQTLSLGDVIQLTHPDGRPYHTLLVCQHREREQDFLLAAHDYDTNTRSLKGSVEALTETGKQVLIYQIKS